MEKEIDKKENLVKKTCKELGITQKRLAEIIGISESSMKKIAVSQPTNQIKRSLELLLENHQLKINFSKVETFQNNLKNILNMNLKI